MNTIKQREQFRPIAPVCLSEDAERWFGCPNESPYMLYTYKATTDALAAVTHVNHTARLQTVTPASNKNLHSLLVAFKARTGYGVLCNTSLNFNGKGFINNIRDLDAYTVQHGLDGFVVDGRAHLFEKLAALSGLSREVSPSGRKRCQSRVTRQFALPKRSRHRLAQTPDPKGRTHNAQLSARI
ncbi:MAG: hypothetical protein M5U35_11670 [Roseovarius sp.]|nr:hypothetical protein [Roseovarius sp.]